MNSIIKVGAVGVLSLGYASAHASIVASKSSSTPGDLLLFAEVVNNGSPVAYYVGDTKVSVGGTNVAGGLKNGGLIQTGGDANLSTLLGMVGTGGNTLVWAVQGGGYDSSFNASVLTTVQDSTALAQLNSRTGSNVGFMITGLSGVINNTLDILVGSGSSYQGGTSTQWDTTSPQTANGFNAEAWFNNGSYTAQNGFGTATLYGVVAPYAGGYSVNGVGTVTLNANGLSFSNGQGPSPDAYDLATRKLTMPVLGIGSATYSNVVVTVGAIVAGPSGTSPNGAEDSFDPASGRLNVQAVTVGAGTYYNPVVTVSALDAIGSVTGADSYDGVHLTISDVQLGTKVYSNVVITVGRIVRLMGGMPNNALDVYDPVTHQLTIAAVEFAGKVYTNVTVTVGTIVSVGGAYVGAVAAAGQPEVVRWTGWSADIGSYR